MRFAKILKSIRRSHNIDQKTLITMVGLDVSISHISQMENGNNFPSNEFMARLSRTFNYDIKVILDAVIADKVDIRSRTLEMRYKVALDYHRKLANELIS